MKLWITLSLFISPVISLSTKFTISSLYRNIKSPEALQTFFGSYQLTPPNVELVARILSTASEQVLELYNTVDETPQRVAKLRELMHEGIYHGTLANFEKICKYPVLVGELLNKIARYYQPIGNDKFLSTESYPSAAQALIIKKIILSDPIYHVTGDGWAHSSIRSWPAHRANDLLQSIWHVMSPGDLADLFTGLCGDNFLRMFIKSSSHNDRKLKMIRLIHCYAESNRKKDGLLHMIKLANVDPQLLEYLGIFMNKEHSINWTIVEGLLDEISDDRFIESNKYKATSALVDMIEALSKMSKERENFVKYIPRILKFSPRLIPAHSKRLWETLWRFHQISPKEFGIGFWNSEMLPVKFRPLQINLDSWRRNVMWLASEGMNVTVPLRRRPSLLYLCQLIINRYERFPRDKLIANLKFSHRICASNGKCYVHVDDVLKDSWDDLMDLVSYFDSRENRMWNIGIDSGLLKMVFLSLRTFLFLGHRVDLTIFLYPWVSAAETSEFGETIFSKGHSQAETYKFITKFKKAAKARLSSAIKLLGWDNIFNLIHSTSISIEN